LNALGAVASGVCSPALAQGSPGWCDKIPQNGLRNCWSFDAAHLKTFIAAEHIGGNNASLSNVASAGSGPSRI
jgi:hypothetical protein